MAYSGVLAKPPVVDILIFPFKLKELRILQTLISAFDRDVLANTISKEI